MAPRKQRDKDPHLRGKCLDPKLLNRTHIGERGDPSVAKKFVLADAQPICRYALNRFFTEEPDLACVAQAGTGQALTLAVASQQPDLVVMGLYFPDADGIELIKTIRGDHPEQAILVFSALEERTYAERALRAGARAFVSKNEPLPQLLDGARCVLSGEIYLSRRMALLLLHRTFHTNDHGDDSPLGALTNRELYVFKLLGAGLSSRKIAAQLGVSLKTIESHRENIKRKLRLQDGSELVRHAVQFVDAPFASRSPGTLNGAEARANAPKL